ncbi:MAG: AzlD domain-containing protein [Brevefilum sp.]|nr:AzlD domain-containing protein [Brevefilum sp.]
MDENLVLLTIIGMAVVTYLPRLIPLLALSGKTLPPAIVAWLRHVPPAVLAAMLLPALLFKDGELAFGSDNLFFWAAIPTFAAAILTKSLFIPVIVGMLVVIVGRLFGG